MTSEDQRSQNWLPSSWLYAFFGLKQFWSHLNGGDRFIAILAAILLAALPLGVITKLSNAIMIQAPDWTGLVTGLSVFTLVSLVLTGTMFSLRGHRYFCFLPEISKRKQNRIFLEWLASSSLSILICVIIILVLQRPPQIGTLFSGIATAVVGHTVVHLVQLQMLHLPAYLSTSSALVGIARRNFFAPFLASAAMKRLPQSSSRFMRKVNANPLVWVVIFVAVLAFGGAAISLQSPLLGISSLSSALLMVQLALIEPRVGNGPAIGAHSKTLPIRRAFNDLMAMIFAHLICLLVAVPLLLIDKDLNNLTMAIGQLVITIWILWLFLLVGALPSDKPPNIWLVAIALIFSQMFPPLIAVLLVIVTIILTRDLMRMSQQGPALWPR